MKLLDPLRQVSVLRIARKHRRLVQMLATVLNAVQFGADLHARLFQVGVRAEAHGFRRANLAARTSELGILLIQSHRLVNVRLHELVRVR